MKTSWSSSWMTRVALGLIVGAAVVACKKDEPPPPLPSATAPPPAPTPTQLAIDETPPPDVVDAGPDAGKRVGTGSGASFAKCCSALQQNAANAPPQNQQAMLAAAGICNALAAQGKEKNSIIAAIQGALRGAAMPAACR